MKNNSANIGIFGVYYLTLFIHLVASYFPEYRVWGFNWWAYYPDWVRWGLCGIGALVPVALRFIPQTKVNNSNHTEKADTNDRKFFIYVGVISAVFGGLFYLLRARTHFQGDGYQLLDLLANQTPTFNKFTGFGSSAILQGLWSLIGGDGHAAALLSYQIISITAGLLFVVVVALFARKLYERMAERVLFLIGVCTGGYMLLFFGYVENYSLFVLSVLTYTLTGLLITQGKTSRYWLLPSLIAALFFHVLGVTLLPSALYLFISQTRFGRTIREWKPLTKLVAAIPILVVTAIVFYHFYTTNYFFQFAFVPLFENQFTVEGYTMFSWNHLVDFLNLLFLLVPGLLVVIVALYSHSLRSILKQRPNIYLLILTSSVLGAVFIFDPKLGMPRDWDLFSFAGVPVVVMAVTIISQRLQQTVRARHTLVLVSALSLFSLASRAVVSVIPTAGLSQFRGHMQLDGLKSRAARTLLVKYFRDKGDFVSAKIETRNWEVLYPQRQMVEQAKAMGSQGHLPEAITLCERAIEIDPAFSLAYYNLASCYLILNEPEQALELASIAIGLNNFDPNGWYLQGVACANLGKTAEAENAWLRATELDDALIDPRLYLLNLYREREDTGRYLTLLLKTARLNDAPLNIIRESGDYFVSQHDFQPAADAYRRAMEKGLDSSYVQQLLEQYPQLRRLLEP